MALKMRHRQKLARKAQARLPDARVLGIGIGSAGPDPRLLAWMFLGGYVVVTILLSLAFQTFVAPGGLLAVVVFIALNKPRYLVRTDLGIALLKKGALNNTPGSVIARADGEILERPFATSNGRRHVELGPERVWVKDSEVAALRVGLA